MIFRQATEVGVRLQAWAVLRNHYHLVVSFAETREGLTPGGWLKALHAAIGRGRKSGGTLEWARLMAAGPMLKSPNTAKPHLSLSGPRRHARADHRRAIGVALFALPCVGCLPIGTLPMKRKGCDSFVEIPKMRDELRAAIAESA